MLCGTRRPPPRRAAKGSPVSSARVCSSIALAAYAEAWVSGAKVVVFGAATSPLAERLIERGARLVHVYDSDPSRIAEATAAGRSKQVSYAPLEQAGSREREGSFDFGIVEDLAIGGATPTPLLRQLARALSRRGMALIAARNPDIAERLIAPSTEHGGTVGYYELYEAVNEHFAEVRMLGQTPFVGYAIADFGATDDPEVRIDTAFLPNGAEEPEWFVALVSALPATAESFSVIQLPLAELGLGGAQPAEAAVAAREGAALAAAEANVARLERALAEAEAKASRLEATLHQRDQGGPREGSKLKARVALLESELRKREEWLASLEARAATADQRADDMQTSLDQLQREKAEAKAELARLERALEEASRGKKPLEDQAQAVRRDLDKAQRELERVQTESARSAQGLEKAQREVERLARELEKAQRDGERSAQKLARLDEESRARAARLAEVEAALRQAEQRAKELSEAGDEASRAEIAALEAALVERAAEVAKLESELHKTERFGKQLISKLRQLEATPELDAARNELRSLAARNAELTADLEALRWSASSLEASSPGGRGPEATPDAGIAPP